MWTSHHSSPLSPEYRGEGRSRLGDAARVDVDHGGAAAELAADLGDEVGVVDRGGVDADLLGASLDEARGVVEGADAAADGEGHEDLFGDAPDHVEHDVAPLVAGGDVEEHQFVGAVLLVAARNLDRVACIAQVEEVDALDDAAAVDVEAGNDPFAQHRLAQANSG